MEFHPFDVMDWSGKEFTLLNMLLHGIKGMLTIVETMTQSESIKATLYRSQRLWHYIGYDRKFRDNN